MNVDRLTFPMSIKDTNTNFGVLTWLLLYRLILITYYLSGIMLTGEQTAAVVFREISIQKHLALIITPGHFSR